MDAILCVCYDNSTVPISAAGMRDCAVKLCSFCAPTLAPRPPNPAPFAGINKFLQWT